MFTVSSTVLHYPKRIPYERIKNSILGNHYELSLVFVGTKRATALNEKFRNKNYTPNVLSFPLTKAVGEIVICPQIAKSEASKFNLSPNGYIAYLFIHGLLHLKGHDHGDTMEKMERKYLKLFKIS